MIVHEFHKLAYNAATDGRSWGGATYMGIKTWKWPCDLHLYAELVWELKPKLIIETGTAFGGSALYFAHLLDAVGSGKVVSIDLKPVENNYPRHPRIAYLGGRSSTDSWVVSEVQLFHMHSGGPVLVVLDSDHTKDHVLAELRAYSSFVPPGSWLVVEDCDINGHPVYPEFGPERYEAVEEWLPINPSFREDKMKASKYMFSFHRWFRRRRE